VDTNIEI